MGFFKDPVGLWVNSEEANINWGFNSSYAQLLAFWENIPTYAWYTGWARSWLALYYPTPNTSLQTGGLVTADWTNYGFCFPWVVDAYYNLSATGDYRGYLNGNFAW
jgi:hypothetical protein